MTIREIPAEERLAAVRLVHAWGFPRLIPWSEWSDSVWLTDDETGIAWLAKGPLEENHWVLNAQLRIPANEVLYGAIREDGTVNDELVSRSVRFPSRAAFEAIRAKAIEIGATRVYAGYGPTRPGWQRWLMRTGFFEKRDVCGPYMDLEV